VRTHIKIVEKMVNVFVNLKKYALKIFEIYGISWKRYVITTIRGQSFDI